MKKTNKEAYALAHYIHDWLHVYTISLKGNSPHTVKKLLRCNFSIYTFFSIRQRNRRLKFFFQIIVPQLYRRVAFMVENCQKMFCRDMQQPARFHAFLFEVSRN